MKYNNIELELPVERVSLSHSTTYNAVTGKARSENLKWIDALGSLPWSKFNDKHINEYNDACTLLSLLMMDYQVCNGGIDQYFFNGFHEKHNTNAGNDVVLVDIEDQKEGFNKLVSFAKEVFPERIKENEALQIAASAFAELKFEERAFVSETVYCEEDEYIMDEETGEIIKNPDYFSPYEEERYEDVIHGDYDFDETFYSASDYLEELLELQAQYHCKTLIQNVERSKDDNVELIGILKEKIPFAFETAAQKHSLDTMIKSASEHQTTLSTIPSKNKGLTPGR